MVKNEMRCSAVSLYTTSELADAVRELCAHKPCWYTFLLFYNAHYQSDFASVSQFGTAVRSYTGKRTGLGSSPCRFGSPLSSKHVVYGHCLVTLPLTIYETVKWLSSLPYIILFVTVQRQAYFPIISYDLGPSQQLSGDNSASVANEMNMSMLKVARDLAPNVCEHKLPTWKVLHAVETFATLCVSDQMDMSMLKI